MKRVILWVACVVSAAFYCPVAVSSDLVDYSKVSPAPHQSVITSAGLEAPYAAESGDARMPNSASPMAKSGYKLKVYIVEPVSRWMDNSGYYRWDFGFLDFLHDTTLSMGYLETFQQTRSWHGSDHGFLDTSIHEDNIMAIAVVFDTNIAGVNYSDPPGGQAYFIYNVLAAAGAKPGIPGYDTAWGGSTHTVFVEEASTTVCPNCPYTRVAMHNIYVSGSYNFLYTTMVVDKNTIASNWMDDAYRLYWVPTCYFDGGHEVHIGGDITQPPYISHITSMGGHAVPAIDLDISMDWVADDTAVSVTVTLKNNQFVNFAPDAPAVPGGPSSGLLESEHIFSASVTDPDGDQVYYMWDWGNELSACLGPYKTGETVNAPHTWAAFGTYSVKVKAKDPYDYESPWSSGTSIKVVARGDANSDGGTNVGDAVFLIGFVFKGGAAPDPALAGDANCDGFPNVGDAVYLIAYVFKGGPPPGCPE